MNPPLSEHMWTTIRISMSARMSGASDTLRPPLCHLTPHSPIVLQPSWLCLTICKRLIHFVFLNKYNLKFGQIYCAIRMHTFSNFKKVQSAIWTNTVCSLDIFKIGQIPFTLAAPDTTFPSCPQATFRHSLVMSYLSPTRPLFTLFILSFKWCRHSA